MLIYGEITKLLGSVLMVIQNVLEEVALVLEVKSKLCTCNNVIGNIFSPKECFSNI